MWIEWKHQDRFYFPRDGAGRQARTRVTRKELNRELGDNWEPRTEEWRLRTSSGQLTSSDNHIRLGWSSPWDCWVLCPDSHPRTWKPSDEHQSTGRKREDTGVILEDSLGGFASRHSAAVSRLVRSLFL